MHVAKAWTRASPERVSKRNRLKQSLGKWGPFRCTPKNDKVCREHAASTFIEHRGSMSERCEKGDVMFENGCTACGADLYKGHFAIVSMVNYHEKSDKKSDPVKEPEGVEMEYMVYSCQAHGWGGECMDYLSQIFQIAPCDYNLNREKEKKENQWYYITECETICNCK